MSAGSIFDSETKKGLGPGKSIYLIAIVAFLVLGGIGYELDLSRSVALVPYFNYLASTSVDVKVNGQPVPTSTISVNLLQLGVGLLWR